MYIYTYNLNISSAVFDSLEGDVFAYPPNSHWFKIKRGWEIPVAPMEVFLKTGKTIKDELIQI